MTLEQWWRKRATGKPRQGAHGQESDWLPFCTLELGGAEFLVVDASYAPDRDEGITIKAPPGSYELQVKVVHYGRDRRVSRLRAALRGSAPRPGRKLGEVRSDTGRTGVCDFRVFSRAWGQDDEASYQTLSAAFRGAPPFGIAALDKARGPFMPFVASGFGDGTFPVFALLEGKRRVGFEIEFIRPDATYPFGERASTPPARTGGTLRELVAGFLKQSFGTDAGSSMAAKGDFKGALESVADELRTRVANAVAEWGERVRRLRTEAPPLRIGLVSASEAAWLDEVTAARAGARALGEAGFELVGAFRIEGQPGIQVAGFAQPEGTVHASLVKAGPNVFVGLVRRSAGGLIEELSNMPATAPVSVPDWLRRRSAPQADARTLLDSFVGTGAPGSWVPATADNYAALAEQDFARYQVWLAERGGRTTAELRERFRAALKLPAGRAGASVLAMARADEVEQALWNWLRLQPQLPFVLDAAAGTLAIVHDELTPDLLATTYWWATADFLAPESEFQSTPARRTFARLVEQRRPALARVLVKETPLEADFYLPASLGPTRADG